MRPDADAMFDRFNQEHFGGRVPKIPVRLNTRLQTTAGMCRGRYILKIDRLNPNPFLQNHKVRWLQPTHIELHVRLFDEIGWDYTREGWSHSEAELTLIHEMAHAFLWEHYNVKGHSKLLQRLMARITGVDANHTYHYLDVAPWQRQNGVRKNPGKTTALSGSFNPFNS